MSVVDDAKLQYFVNREEATRLLLDYVHRADDRIVVDLTGIPGTGKSWLLYHLDKLLRRDTDVVVAYVKLGAYTVSIAPLPAATTVLDPNFNQYRTLLISIADQFGDAFAPFADAALPLTLDVEIHGARLEGGAVSLGPNATVIASGDIGCAKAEVQVSDDIVLAVQRDHITRAFLTNAGRLARDRRVVLLLDDYDRLLNQLTGQWLFTDLLVHLHNTVVVVAREKSPRKLPCEPEVTICLDNLTRTHILSYLAKRLPTTPHLAELADAIFDFSAGHPDAVSIAADLIEQRGPDNRESLLAIFRNLSVERTEHLSELVQHITDTVDNPDVRAALNVAWVARRFDAGLLAALLTPAGEAVSDLDRYVHVVEALSEYSFTERCPAADSPTSAMWRFHEFIRIEQDQRLVGTPGYEDLHRRAATYFYQRMREEDQSRPGETSYTRALRHDAPMWKTLYREWLYHLAHLHDRRYANIALATIYLRVFYWFGWYQPYSLCDEVLEDWARTQHGDEDVKWLELLQDFALAYPVVWKEQEADWDAMDGIMQGVNGIWELGGLDGEPGALQPEQRHLRALTDLFLAQSRLRRIPPRLDGDDFYEDARSLLIEFPDDHWLLPWVAYWLGQSALERGELERASRECDAALRLGVEQGDAEMIACAWQFRGDLRWRVGAFAGAARAYLLAVLAAVKFLGRPATPDSYTRSYHRELCDGTLARIRKLWRNGAKTDAIKVCDIIHCGLSPIWHALGLPTDAPDYETLLTADNESALRTALLLDLPSQDSLSRRIAVRRALGILTAQMHQVEMEDRGDEVTMNRNAAPKAESGAPQRLRWDLEESHKTTAV